MPLQFHMIAGAPDPVAPFSHAVEADGWVHVTGQMPFAGTSIDEPYPEGIDAQTHQVMRNLHTVLQGCGLDWPHVVSVRVYLLHFERDYVAMNRGLLCAGAKAGADLRGCQRFGQRRADRNRRGGAGVGRLRAGPTRVRRPRAALGDCASPHWLLTARSDANVEEALTTAANRAQDAFPLGGLHAHS